MTDHCYIAVKGSLHSTDSCVFGLTTEEIIALSKRFSDSCKEVINGVLFKVLERRKSFGPSEGKFWQVLSQGCECLTSGLRVVWRGVTAVLCSACHKTSCSDCVTWLRPGDTGSAKTVIRSPNTPSALSTFSLDGLDTRSSLQLTHHNRQSFLLSTDPSTSTEPLSTIIRAREDRFGRLVGRGAVIKPRCYMASSNSKNSCSDGACHSFAVPSVHQTLNEMDFDRGLWNAALFGEETRIRNMLDKGVSPDMEDASGYTALHYAARNGHLNICQALIKAGANVNMTTHSGRATALHRAAMCGHTDIVELLLNSGADPLLKDTDGRLALHRAAQAGHAMSASLLLNAAPQSATVPDLYGKFPACYAPGNKDLIKIFGQRT